jgi:hypothetical protein
VHSHEAQQLVVYFQRLLRREAAGQSHEANLVGKSQTIVITAALGYLVHIRMAQRCFTDQFSS